MFQETIDKIIARYKVAAADGNVTFYEILGLVQGAIIEFVSLAQKLQSSGFSKKQTVMQALEQFIDQVIVPLDLPYVPNIIEPAVDGALKKSLLTLASILIDRAVAALKVAGAFEAKEQPEG